MSNTSRPDLVVGALRVKVLTWYTKNKSYLYTRLIRIHQIKIVHGALVLFVLMLYIPVNNFSVTSGQFPVFLS